MILAASDTTSARAAKLLRRHEPKQSAARAIAVSSASPESSSKVASVSPFYGFTRGAGAIGQSGAPSRCLVQAPQAAAQREHKPEPDEPGAYPSAASPAIVEP